MGRRTTEFASGTPLATRAGMMQSPEPSYASLPLTEGGHDMHLRDALVVARVTEALRNGRELTDDVFDRFLSMEMRHVSPRFWTPLVVAMRVAAWLKEFGAHTLLDVGSGVGKFCVATSLAGSATVVGVEHRPHLVQAARGLAQRFDVSERVSFIEGALGRVVLPKVDAYYLFNPFGENVYASEDHLDDQVELSSERFTEDVGTTQKILRNAPLGTLLITYNGFGGNAPLGYVQRRVDRDLRCVLRLYEKTRDDEDETGLALAAAIGGLRRA